MSALPEIVVASHNPVKLRAVQGAFARMFPEQVFSYQSVDVPSGVNAQPATDAETRLGAHNRAQAAARLHPQAAYCVGLEGGIEDEGDAIAAFAWVVVAGSGQEGRARSLTFYLPPPVAALVRQGMELGHADDQVFGQVNSKQANGAIGLLTGNAMDRAEAYEATVMLALAPFKNPEYYF